MDIPLQQERVPQQELEEDPHQLPLTHTGPIHPLRRRWALVVCVTDITPVQPHLSLQKVDPRLVTLFRAWRRSLLPTRTTMGTHTGLHTIIHGQDRAIIVRLLPLPPDLLLPNLTKVERAHQTDSKVD